MGVGVGHRSLMFLGDVSIEFGVDPAGVAQLWSTAISPFGTQQRGSHWHLPAPFPVRFRCH